MEENTPQPCALLDGSRERLARGRYELSEDGLQAKFTPASTVTPEQMATVAFLWPDDGDSIAVSDVRPTEDGLHYELQVKTEG